MRPLIALDTSLLAVPNTARDEDEAEEILGRLIDWAAAIRPTSATQIVKAFDAAEVLANAGAFPSGPNIKALLEMFGLEHVYTTEDIRRSINTILEKTPAIVEITGIEVERSSNCTLSPNLSELYSDYELHEAFVRILGSVLLSPLKCPEWEHYSYVAPGIAQKTLSQNEIHFRGDIDALVPAESEAIASGAFGASGIVRLAKSYFNVLEQLPANLIWSRAKGPASIHLAICLETLGILRADNPDATINSVSRFAVGIEFWDSLNRTGSGPEGPFADAVREACARVVVQRPKYAASPFRSRPSSRKGKWQQVRREDGSLDSILENRRQEEFNNRNR
jgi:hypothetical protein